MKYIRKYLLSLLLVVSIVFSMTQPATANAAVTISNKAATLSVGSSKTLKLSGTNQKITWSSSNKKIATVSSSGKVTAIKPGTATITAKSGSKTYNCEVTIKKSGLTVTFIDVGQGDCSLIQVNGQNLLIDTGEENQYSKVEAVLKEKKITTIHHFIVTHPDSDHMGGADKIIENFTVKKVYLSGYEKTTKEYKELMTAIKNKKTTVIYPKSGDKLSLGTGVTATVLSPGTTKAADCNASSIVLKLVYYENSFLFTGDIDAKVEKQLMEAYDINVDVLKVAHHGSDYSNGILFISKASPQYSIIMVGKDNNYGHPDSNVLKRLTKYSDLVLRTDQSGNIEIKSDGKKLSCTTEKASSSTSSVTGTSGSKTTPTPTPKPTAAPDVTLSVIGNKNSKVYHNSSCSSLPAEKNRVYFDSDEDAEASGYHACKKCH